MTIKEMADVLEVSTDLVTKTTKNLFPDLIKNGKQTILSEAHATAVKLRIQENPHLCRSSKVTTKLEEDMIIKQAVFFLDERIRKASIELENEKKRTARLIHDAKTYTATEIAKELNFKSAAALNAELEKKEIQFKVNGTWVLHAKYSGLDYESVKQEELDNGKIIYNRHWTGKGRDFILELFGAAAKITSEPEIISDDVSAVVSLE